MNNSNLSESKGLYLLYLANGEIIQGWLIIKVGFLQSTVKKCPTNLSINLDIVKGGLHTTPH